VALLLDLLLFLVLNSLWLAIHCGSAWVLLCM
jgi:hypothetical protein